MRRLLGALVGAVLLQVPAAAAPAHKLLVISVDGLDWRYLRDRDQLGLKIPTIRKLLAKSQVADGVVGVWPTITWPSHTAILSGARPDQSGILSNARGTLDPSLSYWSAKKLKVPVLWQCANKAGRTTAAITWPVTMEADITWNLPEVFIRRNGGSMDLESVAKYGTPGLAAEITRAYPSFAQQWVDDRTRTLATIYLLQKKHPDLMLTHLVDLDSDAHDRGPFEAEANATLERTDELIGQMLKALPKGYDFALVSDHGFERVDNIANLKAIAAAQGVTGDLRPMGGLVTTSDPKMADWLRAQSGKGDVGREVPHEELARYAPGLGDVTAFEPAPHVMFGRSERDVPAHRRRKRRSTAAAAQVRLSQRLPAVGAGHPSGPARAAGDDLAQGPSGRGDGPGLPGAVNGFPSILSCFMLPQNNGGRECAHPSLPCTARLSWLRRLWRNPACRHGTRRRRQVPRPGPVTRGPYQPQALLPGGIVMPLFPPVRLSPNEKRVSEAKVYTMDAGAGPVARIVDIHEVPHIEIAFRGGGATIPALPSSWRRAAIFVNLGGRAAKRRQSGALFLPVRHQLSIILRNRLRTDGFYDPKTDEVYDIQPGRPHRTRPCAQIALSIRTEIGVMLGFSAGAELTMAAAIQYPAFGTKNNAAADPLAGVEVTASVHGGAILSGAVFLHANLDQQERHPGHSERRAAKSLHCQRQLAGQDPCRMGQ